MQTVQKQRVLKCSSQSQFLEVWAWDQKSINETKQILKKQKIE